MATFSLPHTKDAPPPPLLEVEAVAEEVDAVAEAEETVDAVEAVAETVEAVVVAESGQTTF